MAPLSESIIKKHPALIVLRALILGLPVDMGGEEYWMDEETRQFGVWRRSVNTETREEKDVFLGVDITLAGFVKRCEGFSEEQLIELAANITLNELRRKEREDEGKLAHPKTEKAL